MTKPLHVETFGSGPDLVLLHGWGMHSGVWGDFALRLAETHRVTLIDLPGHGLSPNCSPASGVRSGQPAPQGRGWLKGAADPANPEPTLSLLLENAPNSAVWLGWSLGGTLATLLAAAHPERVRGLILLACSPCFVCRPDWPWGMEEAVFDAFAAEVAENPDAGLRRFAGLLCQGLDDPRFALKTLRERLETRPAPDPHALAVGLDWLRQLDARPVLPRLSCPALLAGGDRDALVPYAALETLAELHPSFRLARIDGASHVPFLSHEHATLARLRAFLDECPAES